MKSLVVLLEDIPRLTQKDLKPHEVLIKVVVAGSNPKGYKHPLANYFNNRLKQGDDCIGTNAGIGSAVQGFAIGDRVAGFHVMDTPNGTYAEYTICPYQTVMHLSDDISDEKAATLPLAIFTAAVGSAVGSFAIKLAKLNSLIGPIIATAGSSVEHFQALGVDAIMDYRSETVAEDVKAAAGGLPINHFFDAANSAASVKYACKILQSNTGRYTSTLPVAPHPYYDPEGKMEKELKAVNIWYEQIWVGDVHDGKKAGGSTFGGVMSQVIERALAGGMLSGHPYQVVENGLEVRDKNSAI
ncbi:hypothetical protein NU219Hw_g814t1 [Hortaea werneckii]